MERRQDSHKKRDNVIVVIEGPNVNPLGSPVAYGEPDTSKSDLAVELSMEELHIIINIVGEDFESAQPFLAALWEKEDMINK